MRIIKQLIGNHKIKNRDLYYGYVYHYQADFSNLNNPTTRIDVANFDNFVIMQKLTKRERNNYLKSKFNTFIDSDRSELKEYIATKDSNVDYFRIPSLNNIIVPQMKYTTDSEFIDNGLIVLQTCLLRNDFYIPEQDLTMEQVREYENLLNKDKQSTHYYTNNEHDNDLREYYEW